MSTGICAARMNDSIMPSHPPSYYSRDQLQNTFKISDIELTWSYFLCKIQGSINLGS